MRDRRESDRRYHQRHKAERNAASSAWDKAHPERARERKRAYRQRQRAAERAARAAENGEKQNASGQDRAALDEKNGGKTE